MGRRFARFAYNARLPFLLAVLFITAMTSLPADSRAAGTCPRIWEYDYYFDAAHTKWAGYCTGACYPGGAWCTGVQTEYYVRYGGEPCGCFGEQW